MPRGIKIQTDNVLARSIELYIVHFCRPITKRVSVQFPNCEWWQRRSVSAFVELQRIWNVWGGLGLTLAVINLTDLSLRHPCCLFSALRRPDSGVYSPPNLLTSLNYVTELCNTNGCQQRVNLLPCLRCSLPQGWVQGTRIAGILMFRMVYVRVVFTVYIDELLQRLVANLVGTLVCAYLIKRMRSICLWIRHTL